MAETTHAGGSLAQRSFDRILLIKPSSLGDVIHALPVLHGLRRRYPDATIDWLVESSLVELVEGHADVDRIVPFDRRRFGRMGYSMRAAGRFVGFIRAIRERAYDLAIDLQGLFRSGFLARACGASVRIGFDDAREGAAMFYTHHVGPAPNDMHAVDRNYQVADLLGFGDVPVTFNFRVDPKARDEARSLLAGGSDDKTLIAIVPGARWETKRWAPKRFAEAIDQLADDGRTKCVVLGGPDEATLCSHICELCASDPLNLAGRTGLSTLAALVESVDVLLCHDSGVMHLAVALHKPLVCLTGPTNPRRTGPYRRLADVVRLSLECSPCYYRKLSQCPIDHECMRELPTSAVVEAVRRALHKSPAHAETSG